MKKFFLILLVLFFILAIIGVGAGIYVYTLLQPVDPSADQAQRFTIPKGQSVTMIANRLYEAKFIKHPLVFRLVAKQAGLESKIQAGSFSLSPAMTPKEIAEALTKGTTDVWVTIPEGMRREEIAESLANQELTEFDQEVFLELSEDSEGYIFPDTYLVPRMITAETMFSLLSNTFDRKVEQGLEEEIAASEYSLEQAIILASILEREAQGYQDMRHVAGVLWKRIEIGMPLQADATLQYAKGYNATQKSWWVPPLAEDKQIESPFNTYLNPGLPPKPISNPGLDAIKAALDPLETDDLFYIHDRTGQIHFAETLDEHNANVNRYLR
jgi:UPF0755 protein